MSAIPLTERVKEIFHAFFLQPDSAGLRRVFHYFHQDCILSGLEDSQMCVGLDAIEELLLRKKQEKVHLSFRFTNAQYHQRFLQDQVGQVFGNLHILGDDPTASATVRPDHLIDVECSFIATFLRCGDDFKMISGHLCLAFGAKFGSLHELLKQFQQVTQLANQDPVTSLYNHRAFFDSAQNSVSLDNCYLMVVDLDNFKQINDTYGHLTGDAVLKRTGQILRSAVREKDIVGRIGGDEFAVLCIGIDSDDAALAVALRMVKNVQQFVGRDFSIDVHISIGIARKKPCDSLQDTFRQAGTALYQVKRTSKNGCRLFEDS